MDCEGISKTYDAIATSSEKMSFIQNVVNNGWGADEYYLDFIKDNFARLSKAVERLADEKSKQNLCDILFARLLKDDSYYFSINDWCVNQYMETEIMHFTNDEVMADCGAYIGDSAIIFIKTLEKASGKYKRIYCFDPLQENTEVAKRNLRNYSNINFINAGVSDEDGELGFVASGASTSYLTESHDKGSVKTVTLDSAIDEKLTFIKMDIEGFEQQALRGAAKHIRNDKPKLAICLYHKPEDLFEISELIDEIRPSYKMYLRHYRRDMCETVLYCVD